MADQGFDLNSIIKTGLLIISVLTIVLNIITSVLKHTHMEVEARSKKTGILPSIPDNEKINLPPQIAQEVSEVIRENLLKNKFPKDFTNFFVNEIFESVTQVLALRFSSVLSESNEIKWQQFLATKPSGFELWVKMEQFYKSETGSDFRELIDNITEYYLDFCTLKTDTPERLF